MDNELTATVYIDGFNLYHGMVDKGWSRYKWLDLCAFSKAIIPLGYKLGRVWYCTSRVRGSTSKHNRQQNYLFAQKAHNGENIEIKYGNFQVFDTHCRHCKTKPLFCSSCQRKYKKTVEKRTDVNLSTYMLTDCFENLTDCVVLVSGDSDYEAPFIEIGRLFPSVYKVAAYPPKRGNPAVDKFCDSTFDIDESCFRDCQLPHSLKDSMSKIYSKPASWT